MINKNELPKNWQTTKLGEIFHTTSGGTPNRRKTSYYEGHIPWVKSGELDKGLITDTEEKISEEAIRNSSAKVFPKGTLLIALYGATIGKLAFLGIEAATNQAICGIFQNENFKSQLLYYYLLFKRPSLVKSSIGGAQPNISQTILKELDLPLPPFAEQERIVGKIEELFSELDAGIENLKTAQAQLKTYRQAVLKSAFEGKFTEEWRNQNNLVLTAEDLLSEIKLTREKQSLENGKKVNPIASLNKEEIAQLPEIPSEWIWCRNEELLDYVTSGSRDWKQFYSDKGAMFIRTQDINTNVLNFENIARVDLPKKAEGKRSLVEIDDLLMTITGANVGKIAHIDKEIDEAYVSQSVALIRYINKNFARFLYYYLQAKGFGGSMIEKMVYGVGRPVLSLENMRDVPVCFCSLEEQKLIVEEIESRLSVCDKIEETIAASLKQSEALRQSILKKAFEGKLVPQDENDEPASVLLERIKQEREAFLAEQKQQKTTKQKKPKTMAEELKSILKLLEEKGEPINAHTLWQSSVHKTDIDKFYAEVKKLVDEGIIKETDRDGKDSFLALAAKK